MNLERTLAATAPKQWATRQAIVLDWDVGPRYGVCALDQPRCDFFFRLHAEPAEMDLLAIRLFAVSELPVGAVSHIQSLLRDLGHPVGPLWVPTWTFADSQARQEVEGRLDALLITARPTALLVATVDWLHFDGCWNADLARKQRPRSPVGRG
jgi:hypothetical protein